MSDLTTGFKISDLPEGTVVELTYSDHLTERYELSSIWSPIAVDSLFAPLTLEEMDHRENVTVISVPYAITLKLAEWLDNVYTKTGKPEDLIIEAAAEAKKD